MVGSNYRICTIWNSLGSVFFLLALVTECIGSTNSEIIWIERSRDDANLSAVWCDGGIHHPHSKFSHFFSVCTICFFFLLKFHIINYATLLVYRQLTALEIQTDFSFFFCAWFDFADSQIIKRRIIMWNWNARKKRSRKTTKIILYFTDCCTITAAFEWFYQLQINKVFFFHFNNKNFRWYYIWVVLIRNKIGIASQKKLTLCGNFIERK